MEVPNVDIEKMNNANVDDQMQNGDSIFKTFDRPYIKLVGTRSGRHMFLDPVAFFGEKYKLAVDQLMKETTRKAFVGKLRQTVIKPIFEELTSVFWTTPKESQLRDLASAFSYRQTELYSHYLKLPYGSPNDKPLLNDLAFVELHARYIHHIGALSPAEKPNWLIKPSVNRKLSAKIRRERKIYQQIAFIDIR